MRFQFRTVCPLLLLLSVTAVGWAADVTAAEKPWALKLDLSYAQASGNSDTETFAASGEYSADYKPHRWLLKGGYLFAKANKDTTANRSIATGRYDYLFTERLFGFLELETLRDQFAGYDFRGAGGPGLGYDFIKTDTHLLQGLASLPYTYNDFTDGGTDTYLSGKTAGAYTWQINAATKFRQLVDYLVSSEDTTVYFVNSETLLEHRLAAHFGMSLRYLVNYQNAPPGDAEKTDRLLLASLVITY